MLDDNKDNLNTKKTADTKIVSETDNESKVDKDAAAEIKVETITKEPASEVEGDATKAEVEATTEKSASEIKDVPKKNENTLDTKDSDVEKEVSGTVEVNKTTEDSKKSKVIEDKDFEFFDLDQLIAEFKKLLQEESIPLIKNNIEKIKQSFNKKFKILLADKKEIFIKEGGNEIDFHYSSPLKSAFNDLVFEFKTRRERFYKQIELEQKENLSLRTVLIEELKQLIDNAEASTMYNKFQELQKKWRAIGNIPRTKYNDTWRTYHHHVERFYDLLHLNQDFRDLDFKHNLDEKLKLVEKAEELAKNDDLHFAFKELQVIHRMWKEDIGPVARDFREDIWERFSKATKIIHNKRHEFQKELEIIYEGNIDKKRVVIEKITNLYTKTISSHNDWQKKIKELNAYRNEFFKIGRVPKRVSDIIWNEFKEATRVFNKAKNDYYKGLKKDQHTNLEKKKALVEKAESLKDSEDFDSTTEILKQIQSEWKTIGHVPRKFSDKIWKQFKDACNHYFDRLHGNQDEANQEQLDVFNKKKELLERLKSQTNNESSLTLDLVNSYIDDWHILGRLHGNMRHVDTKFNKVINALYLKLDLDEKEISMLKFKNNIANLIDAKNFRKLDNEQLFIRKKIEELNKEIQQLENNISFISNASEDNPLLKNVRDNINNYKLNRDIWKEKLVYLASIDY